MKTIDVQARLGFARAGVAVLRTLRVMGKTMRYRDFAAAIDIIRDGESWHEERHGPLVRDILVLIAAVERHGGVHTSSVPLPFDLVVPQTGEPSQAFWKTSKIVSD
jgi:hypothetical protein